MTSQQHSARPVNRAVDRRWRRGALLCATMLLTCGQALSGSRPFGRRRALSVCAAASPSAISRAAPPPRNTPQPPRDDVIHHGPRGRATPIVLIEQARRVNLSRLGGLQGP
ncbi:MAG: hypothetical protein GY778_26805 [bacterium]|nr:hypothetical protein [bacterium]